MKKVGRQLLFGIYIWASVFIGAMLIFSTHDNNRVFFETLISVILVFFTVIYSVIYYRKVENNFLKEGIKVGLIWLVVNLAIDIPMFSFGPMARPLLEYFQDIGISYLSLFFIPVGMGYLLEKKLNPEVSKS